MNIILGAIALALAVPAAVQAAPAPQITSSVAARHGDLDLNNPAHASIMLRRLDVAALSVCGASDGSLSEIKTAVRRTSCYVDAMNGAVSRLAAPTVSAAFHQTSAAAGAS